MYQYTDLMKDETKCRLRAIGKTHLHEHFMQGLILIICR